MLKCNSFTIIAHKVNQDLSNPVYASLFVTTHQARPFGQSDAVHIFKIHLALSVIYLPHSTSGGAHL